MLIAVGGNSLIRAGEKGTVVEQLANARRTAAAIIGLIRDGYHLVVTHGNGPQVGAQLLRSERAADRCRARLSMFAERPARARSAICWRSRSVASWPQPGCMCRLSAW